MAAVRRILGTVAGMAALARTRGVRVGIARVSGRSMEPTLHQGDRLLVLYGVPPRAGGMAVVRLPAHDQDHPVDRPLAVKRVTGRSPHAVHHWWIDRDNPHEGVDSWQVGPIPDHDVKARVLLRMPDMPMSIRRRLG
ncbi:MAG TPA: S26 family signal peptidase [Candidatus Lustribacter sp.]|nr:S26 family signal peptidase [Candidatus Lustribacter sp.]